MPRGASRAKQESRSASSQHTWFWYVHKSRRSRTLRTRGILFPFPLSVLCLFSFTCGSISEGLKVVSFIKPVGDSGLNDSQEPLGPLVGAFIVRQPIGASVHLLSR